MSRKPIILLGMYQVNDIYKLRPLQKSPSFDS